MAVVFIQASDPAFISEGAGDDRYILSEALMAPGQVVTITDGEGTNALQLEPGLEITSSSTTGNFMVLTLSNGAVVRITNADNFEFVTGATNTALGTGGAVETFAEFVTNSLGLAEVPTGDTAVEGSGVTVQPGGGTDVGGGGGTGGGTDEFTLTADAASAEEGATATFTIANGDANTAYSYNISGVDAADIDGGMLTGSVTTDADGNATISVALAADRTTEGEETLTVSLPNTPLTASVTVNDTSLDNTAPAAEDAALAVDEADTTAAGQLVAPDAEGDDVTFALDAPVAGLTVNADGSYTFDPSANPAAAALTYTDDPLVIEATYVATDSEGLASDPKTLTITVTPTPLSLSLEQSTATVEEGSTVEYTVVASEAVQTAITGNVQIEIAAGDTASLADFGSGSFNPQPVTIAVGDTVSNAVTITPANDAVTETPETFTANATVAGFDITSIQTTVQDPSSVGGLGQTFTLTTGVDTIPGLVGSAGSTGTDGNDTIIGTVNVTAAPSNTSTISALDNINGGLGTDTLKVQVVATNAVTDTQDQLDALTLSNVENVDLASAVALTVDTSAFTGVTDVIVSNITTGATNVTAGATQDVTLSDTAVNNTVDIDGGKDVDVTLTDVTGAGDVVTIGAGAEPAGDVTVSMTGEAYKQADTANTLSAVNVTGGTTISVTQSAGNVSAGVTDISNTGNAITQGNITIDADANTTTVDIKQDAAVAAVNAAPTTGAATETASVVFGALDATDTLTAGGLTFTAAEDMTAAEVAATFASLANNSATSVAGTPTLAGDTQSGGLASLGTYTGNFSGWTSGAATGDTVVFTSTTANNNVTDLSFTLGGGATGTAPTVTTTQGKANDANITGGKAGIIAGVVDITNAAAMTEVTVDGYSAAGSNINGGATVLDTLTLKNGGAFTTSNAASELDLTLEGVNGVYTQTAGAATLNVNSVGGNTAGLAAATSTTLNVSGSGLLNASTGSVLSALTTLKVSETAGLNLGATALGNVTSIDTSGTTGTVTTAFDGTKAVYTGGAGMDMATVTNAGTAVSKAIDLAGGNDKLTLTGAPVVTPTATLDGGADTDMLSLDAASAAGLGTAFAAQVVNFEQLEITGAAGAQAIDVEALGNYDDVTMKAATGSATTLNNFATGGTLRFDAFVDAGNNGNEVIVSVKDAGTNPADTLNVAINANVGPNSTADDLGILTAADVETVAISLVDGINEAPNNLTPDTQLLTLRAADATSASITGGAPFSLTLDAATDELATINAGTLSKAFSLDLSAHNGVAVTATGGSGNDILKASVGANAKADILIGGEGEDQLVAGTNGATLTGGSGNDLFLLTSELTAGVGVGNKESNTYSIITDFEAGDRLQLEYVTAAGAKAVATGFEELTASLNEATATFQNFADAAIQQAGLGDAVWFEFGGNGYVVVDSSDGTPALDGDSAAFEDGVDLVIQLTGVDLSGSSFNSTYGTMEIA